MDRPSTKLQGFIHNSVSAAGDQQQKLGAGG